MLINIRMPLQTVLSQVDLFFATPRQGPNDLESSAWYTSAARRSGCSESYTCSGKPAADNFRYDLTEPPVLLTGAAFFHNWHKTLNPKPFIQRSCARTTELFRSSRFSAEASVPFMGVQFSVVRIIPLVSLSSTCTCIVSCELLSILALPGEE